MSKPKQTVIITAGNQGGGLALTQKFLSNGANVAIIGDIKSHSKDNTSLLKENSENIYIVEADFSDYEDLKQAVLDISLHFKSIDVLINNYSIFNFKPTSALSVDDYHRLMNNVFSTLFLSKLCVPHLKSSHNPHIINISPPIIHMEAAKEACLHHLGFSISKYGMSFCTMGLAEELKSLGIAVNSLWQARPIATKTLRENFDNEVVKGSYCADIYAEAAYLISQKHSRDATGNYYIDEALIIESGLEPEQFAVDKTAKPVKDIFLPGVDYSVLKSVLE